MNSTAFRALCRLLIVSLFALSFQSAMAGMIGTDAAVASTTPSTDRGAVVNLLSRGDVASQLQAQGIDPAQAKARVASMTDQEVTALSGQIQAMPAGANSDGWAIAIVVALVIWWLWR